MTDTAILNHLDNWLEHHVRDEDARDECRVQMLAVVDEDADYWLEQGWTKVFDRADGPTIVEAVDRLNDLRADNMLVDCETGQYLL